MSKQFVLVLKDANGKQIKFWPLEKRKKYFLGRSELQSDILIPHETISRKHAQITVNENSVSIIDLESANGTFVDKKEIHKN